MARKNLPPFGSAKEALRIYLEEYLHHYGPYLEQQGYDTTTLALKWLESQPSYNPTLDGPGYIKAIIATNRWRKSMTASSVIMPDGTKSDAHDIICEGCEKSLSEHSCGGAVTISTGAGASVRSGGRKKDPADIVPCPHCKGRMHMNLPAATVNFECFMRQYWTDVGVITDPLNQRLPVWALKDLKDATTWADDLATPILYGKMESAAGGSGTYASVRPKADPKPAGERAKKRKAAAKGERIEDLAVEVASDGDGMSDNGDDLGGPTESTAETGAVVVEAYKKAAKRDRSKKKAAATGTVIPNDQLFDEEGVESAPVVDIDEEKARKRAERRKILAGSR